MIGNQYKAHKKNVVDLFNSYKQKREEFSRNDGVDIEFLEHRIQALKQGVFKLSVAGEVKAGKSTFINALLGAELLPSDVLQASSAIVEIFKSEKSFLKVTYANGNIEEIYDDLDTPDIDEAKEKLHAICSISEEYRGIPTTLIDELIINTSNDKPLEASKDLINKLEAKSGENLQKSESILSNYIKSRTKSNIPTEIQFGYPLRWDFDELRVVDAPGVNAVGGVQDVSFDYFEEANAILFVHPIKPIESESFKSFVNEVISNRSKDTLFLILTHSGLYEDEEISKLHGEAIRLYSTVIPEERILVVDSLLRLIYCDLDSGKTVDDVRKEKNKKKILASCREQAEDEDRELIDVVNVTSRFDKMYKAIDQFAMDAPNLQLKEILGKIKSGYQTQEKELESETALLKSKLKNPQEFEAEIKRLNDALEKYKFLKNKVTEKIKQHYSGSHSSWQSQIDKLKAEYPELITSSDSLDLARKHTADVSNAVSVYLSSFSKGITKELGKQLEALEITFKEENHRVTLPKVDLESLEKKAKDGAYKKEDEYEDRPHDNWDKYSLGFFSLFRDSKRKTGTKDVYDETRHLSSFKTTCNEKFYEVVNDLPLKSKEIITYYLDFFNAEIDSEIKNRQDALESEKNNKEENNKVKERIEEIDEKKTSLQPEMHQVDEILGNIT